MTSKLLQVYRRYKPWIAVVIVITALEFVTCTWPCRVDTRVHNR